jgi:hypothetical protein
MLVDNGDHRVSADAVEVERLGDFSAFNMNGSLKSCCLRRATTLIAPRELSRDSLLALHSW